MRRQRTAPSTRPVCQLITRTHDRIVGETLLFPTSVFAFWVDDGGVRAGACFVGLEPARIARLRRFLEETCAHINSCGCPEHDGMDAVFTAYRH